MQILEHRLPHAELKLAEQNHSSEGYRPVCKSDSIRFNEAADALGQDGIEAIMSSLAAIQAKGGR
jgi:hypothetical protein